jgi:FkbH-like protein
MTELTETLTILRRADDGRLGTCLSAVRALSSGGFAWRAHAAVRVLRNFTLEPLGPALQLAGFRHGIALDVTFADHDVYAQEILDPASPLGREPGDLVLLGLWLEDLPLAFGPEGEIETERVVEHVESLVERLLARGPFRIALATFAPPLRRILTPRDEAALCRINLAVLALGERHPRVSVVDVRRLIERLGEGRALDARGALLHRAPLRPEACALWAEALVHVIAAAHGAQRKVLALDCDGTLWGGVLGEDGPEGLQLDAHEFPGSAYVAFQEQVLALQRRGVLVVLCSKNEEAEVLSVLAAHPRCRLRPEHVAAHRINWSSKADNLRSLAAELNVGLDSFVFVDDSPYECELVRQALPMVDVRQVPAQPSELPALLRDAAAAFGTGAGTDEDRGRTRSIQAERQRAAASREARDVDDFLASLALEVEIGPPDEDGVTRLAQLAQKTNQVNATTRRHGRDAIEALAASDDAVVLALSARDRFGDYGIVGAAIAVREGEAARVDTFLLSCRALGRRLEDVLLGELVREVARRFGPVPLHAEYLATPRNAQLASFFDARGFACVAATAARRAYLATDEAARRPAPAFITVRRRGRR